MRIYKIEEVPISSNDYPNENHTIFRMQFHSSSIPNVGELLDWVKRQPRTGFGGSARANEFSCSISFHYKSHVWLRNHHGDMQPSLQHVDVRVYTKYAAEHFRHVWAISDSEYDTNMQLVVRGINATNGNIWIDGAYHPVENLMVKPEKFKKAKRAKRKT